MSDDATAKPPAKMKQIHGDDFAQLEDDIVSLAVEFSPHMNASQRTRIRRIKNILSNVRFDYTPHGQVQEVRDGED
ncbi:MAG: hypothetical protein AAF532_17405 [Planctomycetota bacterium]